MDKKRPRIELRDVRGAAAKHDSYYVLVNATWPRGIKKEDLPLDAWTKDLAPSADLRRWFQRYPQRWDEFRRRYFAELQRNAAWTVLAKVVRDRSVTLLYSASDPHHNHAVALKEFVEQQLSEGEESRLDIAEDQPTTGGNPPGTEGPPRRARQATARPRRSQVPAPSKQRRTNRSVRATVHKG